MPIIKAAIKDLRKSEKHRKVNRAAKDNLKNELKEIMKLAKNKQTAEFMAKLPSIFATIDKAAKNNLLHKNNASRKKSRLAAMAKAK